MEISEGRKHEVALELKLFAISGTKVPMSGFNPHYKSRFSTLSDIGKVLKPLCEEHGLTYSMKAVSDENGVGVCITVTDTNSGYSKFATVTSPVNAGTNAVQEAGKNISYLRRYALATVFDLIAEEDDNAHADGSEPAPKAQENVKKIGVPYRAIIQAVDYIGSNDGAKKLSAALGLDKLEQSKAEARLSAYVTQWKERTDGIDEEDAKREIHLSIVDNLTKGA